MYTYYPNDKEYNLYDLNAKYGLAIVLKDYKAYQEKKKADEESIKVGDEVYSLDPNDKSVVTSVDKETKRVTILTTRGKYASIRFSDAHKTGRHFDELEELLDRLRGEDSD